MSESDLQWEKVEFYDDDELVFLEIIPTEGHEEGKDCWCGPELMMNCSECETADTDCWKCGGRGFLEYEPFSGKVPVAIHHDERLD